MRHEIKKIGVWTTAEYFALLGLIIGIILGIGTALYINMIISQMSNQQFLGALAKQSGVSLESVQQNLDSQIWTLKEARKNSLVFIPLCSIVISFIIGLIFALLYNVLAKHRGLTIEFKDEKK